MKVYGMVVRVRKEVEIYFRLKYFFILEVFVFFYVGKLM